MKTQNQELKERINNFLTEYKRICKKYGLAICITDTADEPCILDLKDPSLDEWTEEEMDEHIEDLRISIWPLE